MSVLSPAVKAHSPFASMRGDHAGVRVPDLATALTRYQDVLDFHLMGDMPFQGLTFASMAPSGNDDVRLERLAGPGSQERPRYTNLIDSLALQGWHHVCMRVDSVDDTVARLRERRVEILLEPADIPPSQRRIAFFADPWPKLFELAQPMQS